MPRTCPEWGIPCNCWTFKHSTTFSIQLQTILDMIHLNDVEREETGEVSREQNVHITCMSLKELREHIKGSMRKARNELWTCSA